MRQIVLLFMLLALCAGTATAKRDKGSYVTQYLTITEQINTTLEKLHKDVLVACGEVKPRRDKSRPRKSKKGNNRAEKTNVGAIDEEKIDPAELGEEGPREKIPKQELLPAEIATLRQQLLAELPERVRPVRRRAGRLREIGPVPVQLRGANLHVQGYSRHIDAALDALKQAVYTGKVNPQISAHITAAKAEAAEAERAMGQYLDAKPVNLSVAQR